MGDAVDDDAGRATNDGLWAEAAAFERRLAALLARRAAGGLDEAGWRAAHAALLAGTRLEARLMFGRAWLLRQEPAARWGDAGR